ncbi:MAG: DUF3536 domain-containing protein [Actinobacteria bacterium]|nr:DUF3536 domain-containing protein [Actinomycetota bacterium]
MDRFVCIHGHFYQPPRENPWLEAVEVQDSAYPYHDWNERVTAECYGPNTASRLLGSSGKIRGIASNYEGISYDFGPTLLSWLQSEAPEVYAAALDADKKSNEAFGHGSAMAQAYNHLILPLATTRDKRTQVIWGMRDFRHRFGREAEGMWLPETAVDLESLTLMANQGIRFVVLAPHQASRIRRVGAADGEWEDVSGARVDTRRAYLCRLSGGVAMNVFFYDGAISQGIAFENLLASGADFASRLLGVFSEAGDEAQIAHVATDGETYGHHFPHGDMALAFALEAIGHGGDARLTNYPAFLEAHPAGHEVEIFENTSWSCVHGIERWRKDCGCNTGLHRGWNQAWRAPLREAMDWLRDALAPRYEEAASALVHDAWAARDDYIEIVLDRSQESLERFFAVQCTAPLDDDGRGRLLKLLEMQRHCLLMFTSCGWFFDEISGPESVQVMQYAARALQLARDLFGADLEPEYRSRLEVAQSNLPEQGNGALVYDRLALSTEIDPVKVGVHFAISSLFDHDDERKRIYCFRVDEQEQERVEAGALRVQVGRVRLTSEITLEGANLSFAALHFGDQNMVCKVRPYEMESHDRVMAAVKEAFGSADVARTLSVMDGFFGEDSYSLSSLFRDKQRSTIDLITKAALKEAEAMFRGIYERHAPLLIFLSSVGAPAPKAFHSAAELAINAGLHHSFEGERVSRESVLALVEAAQRTGVTLDKPGLALDFQRALERLAGSFAADPDRIEVLQAMVDAAGIIPHLPFNVDLWETQNRYYRVLRETLPLMLRRSEESEEQARGWVDRFLALGDLLHVETG